MTNKELKKLSRSELLEMLLSQSKEVEKLKEQLKKVNKLLEDRHIAIDNAGSLAEASLQLNGVFQAAQNAAAQYMENIQSLSDRQTEVCARMERESREQAEKLLSEAQHKCSSMEHETQKKCDFMVKSAQEQAQKYWNNVSEKVAQIAEAQADLKALFAEFGLQMK